MYICGYFAYYINHMINLYILPCTYLVNILFCLRCLLQTMTATIAVITSVRSSSPVEKPNSNVIISAAALTYKTVVITHYVLCMHA